MCAKWIIDELPIIKIFKLRETLILIPDFFFKVFVISGKNASFVYVLPELPY